jgi:hypothetical protein
MIRLNKGTPDSRELLVSEKDPRASELEGPKTLKSEMPGVTTITNDHQLDPLISLKVAIKQDKDP